MASSSSESKREYVNNKDFYDALVDYRKRKQEAVNNNNDLPQIPEFIGRCIYDICSNLSQRPNFSGYSFRSDMIGDAIENCILYLDNFDPEKSQNPFTYFTTVAWYAFIRRIEREKKQLYTKYRIVENADPTVAFALQDNETQDSRTHHHNTHVEYLQSITAGFDFTAFEQRKKKKGRTKSKAKGSKDKRKHGKS